MTRAVVAVPAKDEQACIALCLNALIREAPHAIVLVVNNSRDRTSDIAREISASAAVPLHVIERDFPSDNASAGAARRAATARAAMLAGEDGVLLTTDADGIVRPGWIAANFAALRAGAEAVAGRAVLDPIEHVRIPAALHAADALETAYAEALDALANTLDPLPWDPRPRHAEENGASIAVTVAAWRRAGGIPDVPHAEDRRFFDALRRVDARIRHAPEVQVAVSARSEGRAAGGMADTIRRREHRPDLELDPALEPAETAARRARLHAEFRRVRRDGEGAGGLAHALQIDAATLAQALGLVFEGEGWATVESISPGLRRRRVAVADVERETALAQRLMMVARERPCRSLAPFPPGSGQS